MEPAPAPTAVPATTAVPRKFKKVLKKKTTGGLPGGDSASDELKNVAAEQDTSLLTAGLMPTIGDDGYEDTTVSIEPQPTSKGWASRKPKPLDTPLLIVTAPQLPVPLSPRSIKDSTLNPQVPQSSTRRPSGTPSDANMEGTHLSGTLEYLRKWTYHQDSITHKLVEHQKLMEGMMQSLLRTNADGVVLRQAAFPKFDVDTRMQGSAMEIATGADGNMHGHVVAAATQPSDDGADCRPSAQTIPLTPRRSLTRLHSVFVNAIWQPPPAPHQDHRHWHLKALETFVESHMFEYLAACLILIHSMFIGASVEYMATASSEKHTFFVVGNIILVSLFCGEVLIKLIAEREEFFLGVEWRWNAFDTLLITTVFVEAVAGIVLSGKNEDQKKSLKTLLKLAEMVRTLRIVRIFRVLKFSTTLKVIAAKILCSARCLIWVLILFCLMLYVMSVCFTQGFNDFLDGEQHTVGWDNLPVNKQKMHKYFGSVPKSSFTLFASIAGGLPWSGVVEVLAENHFFYAGLFVTFQALSLLAVFNLITGIFVDNAIRSDADIVLEAETRERVKQAGHLKAVFNFMDRDNSEAITLEEFMSFAHDPSLAVYLEALNIKPGEAETLFQLLDEDGSGSVQTEEFLSGCMHLRGESKAIDMKMLIYDNRRTRHRMFRHINEMEEFVLWTKCMLSTITSMQNQGALAAASGAP